MALGTFEVFVGTTGIGALGRRLGIRERDNDGHTLRIGFHARGSGDINHRVPSRITRRDVQGTA